MTTWEYRESRHFDELDALGRAGWELVAVLPSGAYGATTFYLKRPRQDFRERVTQDQKRHYYSLLGLTPREEKQA